MTKAKASAWDSLPGAVLVAGSSLRTAGRADGGIVARDLMPATFPPSVFPAPCGAWDAGRDGDAFLPVLCHVGFIAAGKAVL